MSIVSWKMLTAASVCLIVVSLGAATEMYDEMSPGDMNLLYQEHNFVDPGLQGSQPESKADVMRNLFLYKMLSSLRNQEVSPNMLAGPKWLSSGTVLVPPETFDLSMPKGYVKRTADDVIVPKVRPAKPAAQKWKIKKGKAGSHQMICYFKLCAFRPPV